MYRRFILAFAAAVAVCLPAFCATRPASRPIITESLREFLEAIPVSTRATSKPTSDRDATVIIRCGAARTTVTVVSRIGPRARLLAGALDASLRGTPLERDGVEWSYGSPYVAAQARWRRGTIGALSARNVVPIEPITDGLRAAGFRPRVVLGIARYAHLLGFTGRSEQQDTYVYCDATEMRTAVVEARVTASDTAPLVGVYALPLLAWPVVLLGIRRARESNRPVKERRRSFKAYALVPSVVLAGPQPLWEAAMFRSDSLRSFSDVFLGGYDGRTLLGVSLPIWLVGLAAVYYAWRALGGILRDSTVVGDRLKEEKKEQIQSLVVNEVAKAIAMVGVGAAIAMLRLNGLSRGEQTVLQFFVAIALGSAITVMARKTRGKAESTTPDATLTARAQAIAAGTGTSVWEAVIDESLAGHHAIAASLDGKTVKVSRKSVNLLTAGEVDYLMARVLVISGSVSSTVKAAMWLCAVLPWVGYLCWRVHHTGGDIPSFPAYAAQGLSIGIPLSIWGLYESRRDRRRDRAALALTREPVTAATAILKQAAWSGPSEKAGDVHLIPTRVRTRMAGLDAVAFNLGLPKLDPDAILKRVRSEAAVMEEVKV